MDFFLGDFLRTFDMLMCTALSHERVYTPGDKHLCLEPFFFFFKLRHSEFNLRNAVFENGLLFI